MTLCYSHDVYWTHSFVHSIDVGWNFQCARNTWSSSPAKRCSTRWTKINKPTADYPTSRERCQVEGDGGEPQTTDDSTSAKGCRAGTEKCWHQQTPGPITEKCWHQQASTHAGMLLYYDIQLPACTVYILLARCTIVVSMASGSLKSIEEFHRVGE